MIEHTPTSTPVGISPMDLGYDPWSPAFVADPYPALAIPMPPSVPSRTSRLSRKPPLC